jgi:hypothetical protein
MTDDLSSRIRIEYDPPPIPTHAFDWRAWVDGDEELGTWHGATEAEARREILEWIEDRLPIEGGQ